MSKTLGFAKRHGPLRLTHCMLCRASLHLLRAIFRFDRWHASAPLACRPYKAEAAALAQSVRPRLVVEIGCGLGAIIAKVGAERRVGLDLSPEVIAAARFLNGRRAQFAVASVYEPEAVARAVGDGPIDVLIMVNWVNALSTGRITEVLDALRSRITIHHLLIDETPAGAGLHVHDSRALGAIGEVVGGWRDGERALHLVRLAQIPASRQAPSI